MAEVPVLWSLAEEPAWLLLGVPAEVPLVPVCPLLWVDVSGVVVELPGPVGADPLWLPELCVVLWLLAPLPAEPELPLPVCAASAKADNKRGEMSHTRFIPYLRVGFPAPR